MPALVLGCGHSFHASCIKRMLTLRWPKARITFGFMGCPLCKVPVDHPSLEALTTPLVELHEKVRQMAKLRLSYEGKLSALELAAGGEYYGRPEDYGEHIYTYYECFRCKVCVCGQAYGGCGDADGRWWSGVRSRSPVGRVGVG